MGVFSNTGSGFSRILLARILREREGLRFSSRPPGYLLSLITALKGCSCFALQHHFEEVV